MQTVCGSALKTFATKAKSFAVHGFQAARGAERPRGVIVVAKTNHPDIYPNGAAV